VQDRHGGARDDLESVVSADELVVVVAGAVINRRGVVAVLEQGVTVGAGGEWVSAQIDDLMTLAMAISTLRAPDARNRLRGIVVDGWGLPPSQDRP
jgi:hypothetical protein